MSLRIDLHTHSDRSDGTDPPATLVRAAHDAGIDVLALTDHDTTAGWAPAWSAAQEHGVRLVRGLEISTAHAGSSVHLLGYLPDPTYPPLVAELDRILDGRSSRLPATVARLRTLGYDLTEADVRDVAADAAALGRPHVADALVAKGYVVSREEAFGRLLGPRGPAYVRRYAADLATMVATVRDAGGVSVIAHPWARRMRHEALDADLFERLQALGLAGIEVDHHDHDEAAREALRGIARDLDLVATGSSDHHGTGKVDHDLGSHTTDPEQLERLLERAAVASAASGRDTPAA